MPDVMVEGLSGTEIIDDLLAQIKRKLLGSCNLREADSYGQGYSADVKISLKMYAMDVATDEFSVHVEPKALPPETTEQVTVIPVEVEEAVEIPQELDLEAVRERLKDAPAEPPPPSEEEESRMPARLKRKYTRRSPFEQTPMGGAVDVDAPEPEVQF